MDRKDAVAFKSVAFYPTQRRENGLYFYQIQMDDLETFQYAMDHQLSIMDQELTVGILTGDFVSL